MMESVEVASQLADHAVAELLHSTTVGLLDRVSPFSAGVTWRQGQKTEATSFCLSQAVCDL